jgi:hypothetical protein
LDFPFAIFAFLACGVFRIPAGGVVLRLGPNRIGRNREI